MMTPETITCKPLLQKYMPELHLINFLIAKTSFFENEDAKQKIYK